MTTFNRVVEVLKNFFTGLLAVSVVLAGLVFLIDACLRYQEFTFFACASILGVSVIYIIGKDIRQDKERS